MTNWYSKQCVCYNVLNQTEDCWNGFKLYTWPYHYQHTHPTVLFWGWQC